MGEVTKEEAPPEKTQLEHLDDACLQVLESVMLSVLARERSGAFAPAALSAGERAEVLEPFVHQVKHHMRILKHIVRRAAALTESDLLEEMGRKGVEAELLEDVSARRR